MKHKTLSILSILFVLVMMGSPVVQAQDAQAMKILMFELGSGNEQACAKAFDTLVDLGSDSIPTLMIAVGGENLTADKWARLAVQRLANNSATQESAVDELLEVLLRDKTTIQNTFALTMLTWIGSSKAIPVISAFLYRDAERETARYALERIPCGCATQALIKALGLAATSDWKIALIKTLGERGCDSALAVVTPYVKDINQDVRLSAIRAISKMQNAQAASLLRKLAAKGNKNEQRVACNGLLTLAEGLVAKGEKEAAAKIFMAFYQESSVSHLRCAGIIGYGNALCCAAVPTLVEALYDCDPEVAGAVADSLENKPCISVTNGLMNRLKATTGEEQIPLLNLLALRKHDEVSDVAPIVFLTYTNSKGDLKEAAANALKTMPGTETTRLLVFAFDDSTSSAEKLRLVKLLSARAPLGALRVFQEAAESDYLELRQAGLEGLTNIGHSESES